MKKITWQPIESAPKDGSSFLCYDPNHSEEKIYVVKYRPAQVSYGIWSNCSYPESFTEASGEEYFIWKPTHWMPLPQPPTE